MTFFNDHTGKNSVMRLGFYTLIVVAVVFAYIYPDNETGYLGMLGIAAGMKWSQNSKEKV